MTKVWFMQSDVPVTLDWSVLWGEVISRYAERCAIRWNGNEMTFGELGRLADRMASDLRSNPLWRKGSRIAVSTAIPSYPWQAIGVWLAGGVLLPYNASSVEADQALRERIDSLVECRVDGSGNQAWQVPNPVQDDDTWHAIYFTSGSTGVPKAVVRGWSQAIYEAGHYAAILDLSPGKRCSMLIDPSFGASTKHFLGCLLSGCMQDFPLLEEAPAAEGDVLYGTPSQIASYASRCVQSDGYSWISLTGEGCSVASWKAIGKLSRHGGRCLNALGGSEFGVLLKQVISVGDEEKSCPTFRGTGLPGKTLEIVDEGGVCCPDGVLGLLKVSSPWIAEGYLEMSAGMPVLARFGNPSEESSFLTGDIAVTDGPEFRHLGRSGSMLKLHGRWIDAAPLRKALMESSLPLAEVQVDVSRERQGLRLWIEPESYDPGIAGEVMLFLMSEFGRSPLMPVEIKMIRSMPRNRNGKADLNRLSTQGLQDNPDEILGLVPVSRVAMISSAIIQGDFSSPLFHGVRDLRDLNLDSLEMHELALLLGDAMGKEIPLESLLSTGKLEDLAGKVKASGSGGFSIMGSQDPSSTVICWFGSGIGSVFQVFGSRCSIHYWDCERITASHGISRHESIQLMTKRMLALSTASAEGRRVLVGGFSFGALAAHEAALHLSLDGADVIGSILLDPPDTSYRGIRSPWRWSRWRPFLYLACLKPLSRWRSGAMGRKIQQWIQKEQGRRITELHRNLLRNHGPSRSRVPTWLFTSGDHHQATVPTFSNVLSTQEVIPLPVDRHADVLREEDARRCWIDQMLALLK